MKILIEFDNSAPFYVRNGWANVLKYMGHRVFFWKRDEIAAFDVFAQIEPNIYLGCTYNQTEATLKCIRNRPEMKVALFCSAWGDLVDGLNREEYPIVYVTENEKRLLQKMKDTTGKPDFVFVHITEKYLEPTIGGWKQIGIEPVGILNGADTFNYLGGIEKEEYRSDLSFIGSRWPYKAKTIDKFLTPLCNFPSKYDIKIFGHGGWQVNQYLGSVDEPEVKHLFASAKICPNISEFHSESLGFDLVERIFKVPLSSFLISDHVDELDEIFKDSEVPKFKRLDEFEMLIEYYLQNEDKRLELMKKQKSRILRSETYFHRVWKILEHLDLPEEADICMKKYAQFLDEKGIASRVY